MEDDLSPTSEPEAELSLREAAAIVGLSTKKLGERCADGRLCARKARRAPADPLMWLVTESALRDGGLLGTSRHLEPRNAMPLAAPAESGTFADAILQRMDTFLERLGTYAERAGEAKGLRELLAQERERREAAERECAELRAELQRPPRFRDWFLGRGRGERTP